MEWKGLGIAALASALFYVPAARGLELAPDPRVAEDKPSPPGVCEDKPCDLQNVRDGWYCDKCKKPLKDDELVEKEYCRLCGQGKKVESAKTRAVKVCDKEWIPKCGMHDFKPHLKPCCPSKMCCKIDHDLALVEFKCATCGAKAAQENLIKHSCKEPKVGPVCAKSGTFPHGGDK